MYHLVLGDGGDRLVCLLLLTKRVRTKEVMGQKIVIRDFNKRRQCSSYYPQSCLVMIRRSNIEIDDIIFHDTRSQQVKHLEVGGSPTNWECSSEARAWELMTLL